MKYSWSLLIFVTLFALICSPLQAWCPSGAPDPTPRPPDEPKDPGDPTPPPDPGDPAPKKVETGPKEKGGSSAPSLDIWELWWESNKDRYLLVKEIIKVEEEEKAPDQKEGSVIVNAKNAAEEPLRQLLRKTIKDNDRNIRMVAAAAIGRVADPKLTDLLLEALASDKSDDVVDTAVISLGIMGSTKPVDKIWEILSNPKNRAMTRGFAAIALGFTRSNAKTADMVDLLFKEKDEQVKAAIAVGLGLSGDLKAIEPLGKVVLTSNKKVFDEITRSFAAVSLGRLKHADTLPYILKAVESKEEEVRRAAWLALGEIEISDPKMESIRTNTLINGIKKEDDSQALGFLLVSLGKTNSNLAHFHLKKQLLDAKNANVRGFAAMGLGLLRDEKSIQALHEGWKKSKTVSLMNAITIGFGLARETNAVPLILERMKERKGDRTYQVYAAEAFGLMRAKDAVPALTDLLKGSANFVDVTRASAIALQMIGENVRPQLEKLMKEGNNFIVANAALTLGQIGNKEVLKSLLDSYETMNAFAKQYGIVAMGRIYEQRKVTIFKELSINNNYRARTLVYDHVLKIP